MPDLEIDPILSLPQHARWLARKRVTLWRRAVSGCFGPALPIPGSRHVGYALSAVAEYYGITPSVEQLHAAMTTKPDRAVVPDRVQMPRHRFRQFVADEIRRRDARWRAWHASPIAQREFPDGPPFPEIKAPPHRPLRRPTTED